MSLGTTGNAAVSDGSFLFFSLSIPFEEYVVTNQSQRHQHHPWPPFRRTPSCFRGMQRKPAVLHRASSGRVRSAISAARCSPADRRTPRWPQHSGILAGAAMSEAMVSSKTACGNDGGGGGNGGGAIGAEAETDDIRCGLGATRDACSRTARASHSARSDKTPETRARAGVIRQTHRRAGT